VSDIAARRVRGVDANLDNQDSDHQPLLLDLDDR
jgi:hypothetical protein